MKKNKLIVIIIIAAIIVACIGIVITLLSPHEHSFGEWETATPAACESAEVEMRKCRCGEEETREGDPATGHTLISISAESKLEKPMATMVITAKDIKVVAACGVCGEDIEINDGIEMKDTVLVLGKNTLTVKYGEFSTTLTIEAAKLDIALDGTVCDDTYVSSSNKDNEYSSKKEMGTNLDLYRIYFRVNIGDITESDLFLKNKDNAKVRLVLAITSGRVTDETTFRLKAYAPSAGVTDVDFSKLTWNSVDNKEGSAGKYSALHWSNGAELVSDGEGYNVSVDKGYITITLSYSQIADYMDKDGNILLLFATNTSGLKVGSLENKTETNHPAVQVVLNDEHFHVFDQEVVEKKYLASAKCTEKAEYYKSCSCGTAGTITFEYGEKIPHTYMSISAKSKLGSPVANTVVKASDVRVTGLCGGCRKDIPITNGITLGGTTTLASGANKITVKCVGLSTTLTINVTEPGIAFGGSISDDTYVSSSDATAKNTENSEEKTLGTNSTAFRTYLRANVSDVLKDKRFPDNKSDANVRLVLAVADGSTTKNTKFTLKAYAPVEGVTDAAFSKITWNSVDKTTGSLKGLHWSNGTVLVSEAAGDCVSVKNGYIIITLSYSKIEDYVDKNGNILLAFGTDTSGLKVASMENTTYAAPEFKVIIDDDHIHTYSSISAVSKLENPMAAMVVQASDLSVTGTCSECAESLAITDGLVLENATLVAGNNTITVKYGELSTTVAIEAAKFSVALDGTLTDDTYVYSSGKNADNSAKAEMGTNSSEYRVYLRLNIRDVLQNEQFDTAKAKMQLIFAVTTGSVANDTTFTLKSYDPEKGGTDIAFSGLTWNSVNNGAAYSQLNWNSGTVLVSGGAGHNVSVGDSKITITLAYSQIADFVDADGNVLFAFATNTKGLKVGSVENATEANRPVIKVMINDEHFHVFDQEAAQEKYLASAKCEEKAKYYKSCVCGEAGADSFEYGEVIAHSMQTKFDEDGHWTKCDRDGCDEATEKVAHFGGTATETEKAVCEGCGQSYGELASHEHSFGDWETKTPATCTEDAVQARKCGCGEEETQTVAGSAIGHNMVIHYDETHHWAKCDHDGCDEETEKVAHSGGTATETEKAVCEGCKQPYGELKQPESTTVTVSGAIVDDTYVDSGNKDKDFSTSKTELNVRTKGTTYYRSYFRFNFSNVLNTEGFAENKETAKVQFTFAVTEGTIDNATTFTFYTFKADDATKGVAFSNINWNSVAEGAPYEQLGFNNGYAVSLVGKQTMSAAGITYEGGLLTITVNYSAIEPYMDSNGRCLFGLTTSSTDLKVASMEHASAHPAVSVTFVKEK